MQQEVNLIKEVYGRNTYVRVVDTSFKELYTPITAPTTATQITVEQFFDYYNQLFFDIPVSGTTNSHTYLVQRSQQYIGAGVMDQEKLALIEEINSLREQIITLTSTYLNISNLT